MPLPYPMKERKPYVKPQIKIEDMTKTEVIQELTKKQDGLCAICGVNFNYKNKRILDLPRGILCYNCNKGLKAFNKDTRLLTCAIEYLAKDDEPQIIKTFNPTTPYVNPNDPGWWTNLKDLDFSS